MVVTTRVPTDGVKSPDYLDLTPISDSLIPAHERNTQFQSRTHDEPVGRISGEGAAQAGCSDGSSRRKSKQRYLRSLQGMIYPLADFEVQFQSASVREHRNLPTRDRMNAEHICPTHSRLSLL